MVGHSESLGADFEPFVTFGRNRGPPWYGDREIDHRCRRAVWLESETGKAPPFVVLPKRFDLPSALSLAKLRTPGNRAISFAILEDLRTMKLMLVVALTAEVESETCYPPAMAGRMLTSSPDSPGSRTRLEIGRLHRSNTFTKRRM